MFDYDATRVMNDGYMSGTPGRTSQACYFDCMEYDADQEEHFGKPRGPAAERTVDLVSDWFSGAIVADAWCREFDHYLEKLERDHGKENDKN